MIKAVAFDVGHTLVYYDNPLNWSSIYIPALKRASDVAGISVTSEMLAAAANVLTKYNTRINYRETEVASKAIFGEILTGWGIENADLLALRSGFFSYFQNAAAPFSDAADTLAALKRSGIKIGVLTDVAYGMEDELSLKDISQLSPYIDLALTSVDVGFRKPNRVGFDMMLTYFGVCPDEMMYIGDEEKDIAGANNAGIVSVLINRSANRKAYSQMYTINTLHGILSVIAKLNSITF